MTASGSVTSWKLSKESRNTLAKRDALYSDELVQTWVVHHLMIVGEACRALSAEFRAAHPEDVWALAGGLRNVIVHEYFGIDLEIVWGVIERDLPALKKVDSERYLATP